MTTRTETYKKPQIYKYDKAFLAWLCMITLFWPGLPILAFAGSSWIRGIPFYFDISRINSKTAWVALALCYVFFLSITAFYISQRKDITVTNENISSSTLGLFTTTICWPDVDNITIRTFRSPSRGVDTSAVLVRARNSKLIIFSDRINCYPKLLAYVVNSASENAVPVVRQG